MFQEITAILLVAGALGVTGLLLRQPLIVSWLTAGILVAPPGLCLITTERLLPYVRGRGMKMAQVRTPVPPGFSGF